MAWNAFGRFGGLLLRNRFVQVRVKRLAHGVHFLDARVSQQALELLIDHVDAGVQRFRAISLGINYFDTAPMYGNGESERNFGRVLKALKRPKVYVGTKVFVEAAGDIGKFKLGQWVLFNDISGHRDANYTDCPGDWLYAKFRAIRTAVFSIGLPKIFNPRESPAHFVYTQGIVTWTANASARMRWNLNVLDSENNVVDAWWTRGTSFSVTWNGYTRGGDPVPPGTYTVKLLAWNGSGKARGADFTLTIDPIPSPSPSPSPSS